ncbi:MAG TPA: TetR/AcrR family transcriptional regulator [Chloroflexota bacterium]|jgi:AcrR family transcriptional regulator|nr:TetR/AcrR family transcriptional regulator [Chloroflexota bacterium]
MSSQYSTKRQAIVAAARELVAERGSAGAVAVDEVAARAGTTKATIYRHFAGKAALMAEVGAPVGEGAGARGRILEAAVRVIPRYGLAGATMERIAEEAGVSPPTLYWYFKSKDDLLVGVVERVAEQVHPLALLGAPPPPDEPERVLAGFVGRAMQTQIAHVDFMRTMVVEVGNHPELAAVLYERLLARVWGGLSGYIQLQAARGRFRPGHPLLRVVALAGMFTFYNLARRNFGDRVELPPPEEAAQELLGIFLEGVSDGRRGS